MNKMPEDFDEFTRLVEDFVNVERRVVKSAEPMDYIRAMHLILCNITESMETIGRQSVSGRREKDVI